ncbi:hypothetical protein PanWU01x14_279250, partial [Parasponia andersonii]
QSPSLLGTVTEALTQISKGLGGAEAEADIETERALLVPWRVRWRGLVVKTTPFRRGRRWCLIVEERAEAVGWILAVDIVGLGFDLGLGLVFGRVKNMRN